MGTMLRMDKDDQAADALTVVLLQNPPASAFISVVAIVVASWANPVSRRASAAVIPGAAAGAGKGLADCGGKYSISCPGGGEYTIWGCGVGWAAAAGVDGARAADSLSSCTSAQQQQQHEEEQQSSLHVPWIWYCARMLLRLVNW